MLSKERIELVLKHQEPDKVPIHDTPWESTVRRWYGEGLPKSISVGDFFEYEMIMINADVSPQYSSKIIEEEKEFIIERNNLGQTVKNFKDRSTTPLVINSPIKDKRDWASLKERLTVNKSRLFTCPMEADRAFSKKILSWDTTINNYRKNNEKGKFICFSANTGFGMIQHYLGMEGLLLTMVNDPSWAKEMFIFHSRFFIKMFEFFIENGLKFNGIFLSNDMGYKNGLLFSPRCYRELIFPGDKLMCDYFHSIGLPVLLHSDGNISELIPDIINAGFDCIHPLEVKSGMDVRKLKKEYGDKLSFMGGIDVRFMSDFNTDRIEEEIKNKFAIAKKDGGYIYHSDHSVPNNVSFPQYEKVIELVKKYSLY